MELKLNVDGMHCPSCALSIEEELEAIDGVAEARASYPRQQAQVVFDEGRVDESQILEAIAGLGYRAAPKD